jgi:hypothetical protein
MNRLNERGAINILLVPLILAVLFFVAALGFGFWAYGSQQDYKNNSDQKVAVAVQEAITATQETDAAKYAEEAKKPYDQYIGPAAFGNITLNYPKTWSAYVQEDESGNKPINAFLHPKVVPDTGEKDNAFALRIELVQDSYDQVTESFKGALSASKVSLEPYKLAKVPSVVGSRIEGQITSTKQGTMVILPLRNMTLKIWTEDNANFKGDLDTHILPNLSFVP